jgi:glucose/arabinose dehydrogenase
MYRQRFFGAIAAGIALLSLGHLSAAPALDAVQVANGLSAPLFVTAPPNDYNRLFIVEKGGTIRILNLATGTLKATAFLDISAKISTDSEQGLLGLAFDPDYASNGKFYLYFVVPGGFWGSGSTHVSQFQVSSSDTDQADSASIATIGTPNEKLLVSFDHPQQNHDAGWIGFSPRPNDDHNLYIATGDGGNGDDQGLGHLPGGNAQDTTTLLGKILRVHVDPTTAAVSIPSNNPFAGSGTAQQAIFALGLRNPFRDSFDRLTGRLFIGDVGQNTREEVDVQQATHPGGGENYGWRVREGFIQNPTYPNDPVPAGAIDPIIDYPRSTGGTVIGGYVYRGKQIPALQGTYVFGDYLAGKIFTLNYDGASASNFTDITSDLFPSGGPVSLGAPSSFGEDANGELYICDINNGAVFRIVPPTPNVKIDNVIASGSTSFTIHGIGVPFTSVTLQSASDPNGASFGFLTTVPVAGDGTFQHTDTTANTSRFYRAVYP